MLRASEKPEESTNDAVFFETIQAVQKMRRRLVICLDGTWNARDSGTNIYHLSNLVQEGVVGTGDDLWFQLTYYDPGVGTGVLDGVTGGAFGIGLSENVREAYDWLVEKYRDGDEVYIFGFSRGAFTARSLAGLIAKCGLLYRGAPMPPHELWNAYRLLGRYPNPATEGQPPKYWWERVFGQKKAPFLPISELKPDDWLGGASGPGPDAPPHNEAERLLCQWSRRIRLTCLGVFDTVGSLGVDALAIPWLREHTAQFHDTQLSAIVQNGFQALAIDEHRANFHHIPWHRPVATPAPDPEPIEQRWFAGAHSNIGGSYEDDLLAQYPLAWMMEKCAALGLQFRSPKRAGVPDPHEVPAEAECVPLLRSVAGRKGVADQCPHIRDSFADLGHGLWRGLIRSKRDYRTLNPAPEFQNSILVKSINERVDDSVWKMLALENSEPLPPRPRYNPPNLWNHRPPEFAQLPRPKHRYLEDASAWRWLIAWLACVALVGYSLAQLFRSHHPGWIVIGTMAAALANDWTESTLNFATTLEPDGFRAERRKAFATLCLFLRLIVLLAIGLTTAVWLGKIWPWIIALDPSGNVFWLLAFNAIVLYCTATAAWCAAPMWDAGFGQIVPLQFKCTPAGVVKCLRKWAASTHAPPDDNQLLLPVAHTLWRDLLGYIPAYTSLIFCGSWLALSVWGRELFGHRLVRLYLHLFSNDPRAWQLALAIALLCALGDYIEDIAQLSHVRRYPRKPNAFVVIVGFLGTLVKFAGIVIGGIAVVFSLLWLVLDQLLRVIAWFVPQAVWTHKQPAGALSVIAILATILLATTPISDFVTGLKRRFVRARVNSLN